MRAGTEWSSAERESMATFVSERSSCRFCTSVHRAVAEAVCDVEIVDAVLQNIDTAPVSDEMRATLRVLERMTLDPRACGASTWTRRVAQGSRTTSFAAPGTSVSRSR